jgi:16S rRNA (guanine1207-N2)-methyltransferase
VNDHYFSGSPESNLQRVPVAVSAWGHRLNLSSASGVFAQGRLDRGTSVLFRATSGPATSSRNILDLGCGYGAISCALAVHSPAATVWAVDVNERALQLAAENAHTLGLVDRLRPCLPEQVPEDVSFDEIWSNPPIRIGKPALHALLGTWLTRLTPTGRALMVVGKNLGADSLQRWLIGEHYACRRLASAKGFRVLEVTAGASAKTRG